MHTFGSVTEKSNALLNQQKINTVIHVIRVACRMRAKRVTILGIRTLLLEQ